MRCLELPQHPHHPHHVRLAAVAAGQPRTPQHRCHLLEGVPPLHHGLWRRRGWVGGGGNRAAAAGRARWRWVMETGTFLDHEATENGGGMGDTFAYCKKAGRVRHGRGQRRVALPPTPSCIHPHQHPPCYRLHTHRFVAISPPPPPTHTHTLDSPACTPPPCAHCPAQALPLPRGALQTAPPPAGRLPLGGCRQAGQAGKSAGCGRGQGIHHMGEREASKGRQWKKGQSGLAHEQADRPCCKQEKE
jgi:hypothetical protein